MDKNQTITEIRPKNGWFDINLKEVWQYRDLIRMFVKRSFTTMYKQTILGPLWFIINPLLTTLVFTVIFGNLANLSTEGVPPFLFYLAGNTLWSYFASCITNTSSTFTANSGIMGKVYFPRITMPLATVIFGLLSFGIQFVMLVGFAAYYGFLGQIPPVNWSLLWTPILVLQVMLLGFGFGIIISSLTTKYRDLNILVGFGVSLWMYATPVVYASSTLPEKWRGIIMLNPMSPVIETFRSIYLEGGQNLPYGHLTISMVVTAVVVVIGVVLFSRVEKTFMDTV